MKFVILAATVGYVFGAVGDDCEPGTTECGDAANYCDLTQPLADGTAADTSGTCAAKILSGEACNADGVIPCNDADTCTATACAGATQCGTALANADGAVGGCCNDSIAAADAANFCLGAAGAAGVVTVKVADAGVCSVIGTGNTAGAASSECASGSCTATALDSDDADVGACDATATEAATTAAATTAPAAAGADGGDCLPVTVAADLVPAVTACGTDLTCSTAASDGDPTWCQTTAAPTETADADAAAGAVGGACTADEVAAVVDQAACTGALVCTGTVTTAGSEAPGTCGAAATTDDSPAAIFYGMSMVMGAVAYLL